MNRFQEQLDMLDEQLEAYSPLQLWGLYLGSAAGIVFMSWMFFASDMLDELIQLQDQNSALVEQIHDHSAEAYNEKITASNQKIMKNDQLLTALANEKAALMLQLSQSQGLIFNNQQFAHTLDLLLEESIRQHLKIEKMEVEDTDQVFYGKVKQFKKLTIRGSGNFRSIAAFLTFIETQKTLVEIRNVQIRSDEHKPSFEAIVYYMGVEL